MPDLEHAREAAGSLELLLNSICLDGRHLAGGLEAVKPPVDIALMRAASLKAKLTRAQRLVILLEAVLSK
jgi:hypothetical protein